MGKLEICASDRFKATMNTNTNTPINHLDETTYRWFALRTRSKSEKFVQRLLEKKGITCYLPLQLTVRRYGRTMRRIQKPLINCYVFVHIVKSQYVPVLETENVAGFIRFSKDLISIPESEIALLRRITLEEGLELEVVQGKFEAGDAVEIAMGNLVGLKGRIVKADGKKKMQVELDQIGYSLLITIDAAFLAKTQLPATFS